VILSKSDCPQVFGTGLIALDLVMSADSGAPVQAWAGGTCGNVLSILALLGWDVYPIARLNDEGASERIRADMKRWGVHLQFADCGPTTDAPIIIQHILRTKDGSPKHKFSWTCPHCGSWLPGFKPVTTKSVEHVVEHMSHAKAFFMDRLSRSALVLAQRASENGAVVVFEPSAKSDEKLLSEALKIAHIVKYSDDRFGAMPGAMDQDSATVLEIQTLGEAGLRYRHRRGRSPQWKHLKAVTAPLVVDTCGSGDWCTAGLISKIAANGQEGLRKCGVAELTEALQFGQRLSAWNVAFEGARGAMYAIGRGELRKHLNRLALGPSELVPRISKNKTSTAAIVSCPACPSKFESLSGRI